MSSFSRPSRRAFAVLLPCMLAAVGCSSSPVDQASSSDDALVTAAADHDCRVYLMSAGIPTHASVDGDFNQVTAVSARQDASGKTWWPLTADVGVKAWGAVAAGIIYSLDGGATWNHVESTKPTKIIEGGTALYHFEWGDGLIPFKSGSLLMCQPGAWTGDCLASQSELVPIHVEAYVRMPDGTTYYDHNAADADHLLEGDFSNVTLDRGDAWQEPQRDLLHCMQPGT